MAQERSYSMEKTIPPVTLFAFVSRKPGTSFEEFKAYYENHHAILGHEAFLRSGRPPLIYTRHYIDKDSASSFPRGGGDDWEFDCVTRTEYQDQEHLRQVAQTLAENREEILKDEPNFLDQSKLRFVVVQESVSYVYSKRQEQSL